jgi:hypothetical protein
MIIMMQDRFPIFILPTGPNTQDTAFAARVRGRRGSDFDDGRCREDAGAAALFGGPAVLWVRGYAPVLFVFGVVGVFVFVDDDQGAVCGDALCIAVSMWWNRSVGKV